MKSPSSIGVGALGVATCVALIGEASCRGPLPAESASAVPSEQPASTLVDVAVPELPAPDAGVPPAEASAVPPSSAGPERGPNAEPAPTASASASPAAGRIP